MFASGATMKSQHVQTSQNNSSLNSFRQPIKTSHRAWPPTTMSYDRERAKYLRYLNPSLGARSGRDEEVRTTPFFSLAVKHAVDHAPESLSTSSDDDDDSGASGDESDDTSSGKQPGSSASNDANPILPQYSLLGFNIGSTAGLGHNEPIMLNMNAPNSAFICGSQGSGKSYTLSCMLENCLLPDPQTGNVEKPVAGVVFHYDLDTSGSVAEAATLCSRGIKVKVLVSESNYHALNKKYTKLPGARKFLTVQKLKLNSSDLSVERMHKLMAFSEKGGSVPLYMETIQRILRQMAITAQGHAFNYTRFKALLAAEKSLSRDQTSPMTLRLDLLESFMHATTAKSPPNLFDLQPGTLTVLDLTAPFVDPATVCVLFDICLSLAKETRRAAGLVVALDEAHKYMEKDSSAAVNFTARLLTTIREQRHNAVRVLIATQEPTISERLLDLCSVTVVHGFKSPAWFAAIRGHLGAASALVHAAPEEDREVEAAGAADEAGQGLFERIVRLQVGESLVFSPGAFVRVGRDGGVGKLGTGVMKMLTRKRLGVDAGCSVLASGAGKAASPAGAEHAPVQFFGGGNDNGLADAVGKIKFF